MRRHESPRLGVAGALNKNQSPAGISATPSLVHLNPNPPSPLPRRETNAEGAWCKPTT
jgi:hypothetical protein